MKSENKISYDIRGVAFKIYNELGPGLLESVYETVLKYELTEMGYPVKSQLGIPVYYKGIEMDLGFRLDLLVNKKVIVEIKSVEELCPVHFKQVLTYLRLTDLKLGLLINFNTDDLKKEYKKGSQTIYNDISSALICEICVQHNLTLISQIIADKSKKRNED